MAARACITPPLAASYVVRATVHWPFTRGPGSTRSFPEFDAWLDGGYLLAEDFQVQDVEIWVRRDRVVQ